MGSAIQGTEKTTQPMPAQPGIVNTTTTLAASIEGAHCAFTGLEQRLAPILKPERPSGSADGPKDEGPMSQEREDLGKIIGEVRRMTDRINELNTRIDL